MKIAWIFFAIIYLFVGFWVTYFLYRKTDLDFKATTNIPLIWPVLVLLYVLYCLSRKIEQSFDKPAADVNNGIVFFECETCDHEQKHTSFVKPMKKPSSLYFITEDEAATALKAMRKMVEENGFVSINMVNEILGGEHHILSKWGWTDLSKARVVKSENYGGYYISFPSVICDRPKLGEVCDEL